MPQAAVRSTPTISDNKSLSGTWVGCSIERIEDAALLSGRGRVFDDLGSLPGTPHAGILRPPHVHVDIVSIDLEAAECAQGVVAVITGKQVKALTSSLAVGVKSFECWPIAVDRVRYVGEPGVVMATDCAFAEDAAVCVSAAKIPTSLAIRSVVVFAIYLMGAIVFSDRRQLKQIE